MTPRPQHPQDVICPECGCHFMVKEYPLCFGGCDSESRTCDNCKFLNDCKGQSSASHSSAGAQQRIEQAIKELEKIKGKCDAKTSISEEPFHTGERAAFRLVKCWIDEAIALLQAGEQHE